MDTIQLSQTSSNKPNVIKTAKLLCKLNKLMNLNMKYSQ